MDIVGERIMLARKRRGIKQRELASLAHLSQKHLSQVETGTKDGFKLAAGSLRDIAQALGVSSDYLLGLSDQEHPHA